MDAVAAAVVTGEATSQPEFCDCISVSLQFADSAAIDAVQDEYRPVVEELQGRYWTTKNDVHGGYMYEQSDAFAVISSFCGQYLGFASYGDASRYNLVWLINILLGVLAAVIHLPIKEKAVGRYAVA